LLFTLFYRYLYGINIARNRYVVVQQEWIRAAFEASYPCQSVIVAYPSVNLGTQRTGTPTGKSKFVLVYPALPRIFKNYEVICQAVARLAPEDSARLEVRLTIDGSENRYSHALIRKYGSVAGLRFIGLQGREAMQRHYVSCDAVLFPSRLETWGLPITEAKAYGKPLLVANLPYARETVGDYELVAFLDPRNVKAWACAITQLLNGQLRFDGNCAKKPDPPFTSDWPTLWQLLTTDL
jgi:glycosyltransferase involved in cell wall biosynthesis